MAVVVRVPAAPTPPSTWVWTKGGRVHLEPFVDGVDRLIPGLTVQLVADDGTVLLTCSDPTMTTPVVLVTDAGGQVPEAYAFPVDRATVLASGTGLVPGLSAANVVVDHVTIQPAPSDILNLLGALMTYGPNAATSATIAALQRNFDVNVQQISAAAAVPAGTIGEITAGASGFAVTLTATGAGTTARYSLQYVSGTAAVTVVSSATSATIFTFPAGTAAGTEQDFEWDGTTLFPR